MMNAGYSIAINFYFFVILLVSPFNSKAKRWIKGRKDWEFELQKRIKNDEKWMWFHCSSLGEFEDSCEIFFKIQQQFPEKKTILTVFSPSAYESISPLGLFDFVTYLPKDSKRNARTFMDIVSPDIALFSRSELWYYFLMETKAKQIPAYLISLKLTKRSNFLKWPLRIFYRKCFAAFDLIYCQNTETKKLLNDSYSLSNTRITGNTRFERVYNQSLKNERFPSIEKFIAGQYTIILGSCLPKDERLFLQIRMELKAFNIKWILVPHEIDKSLIARNLPISDWTFFSRINEMPTNCDILIIDQVGILKHLYAYANFALIGGGFDQIGIHNVIEPAVYGVPVGFGPNHRNYDEAIQLMELGGAFIFQTADELKALIISQLRSTEHLAISDKIKQFVKKNATSSTKIVDSMLNKIKD